MGSNKSRKRGGLGGPTVPAGKVPQKDFHYPFVEDPESWKRLRKKKKKLSKRSGSGDPRLVAENEALRDAQEKLKGKRSGTDH